MAENIENFRDQLTKLAESVELLENTFLNEGEIEIKVSLYEGTFLELGSVDFTFLKK